MDVKLVDTMKSVFPKMLGLQHSIPLVIKCTYVIKYHNRVFNKQKLTDNTQIL